MVCLCFHIFSSDMLDLKSNSVLIDKTQGPNYKRGANLIIITASQDSLVGIKDKQLAEGLQTMPLTLGHQLASAQTALPSVWNSMPQEL